MKTIYLDFSDIHCHILPGLDDGAKNLEASIAMAKQFEQAGFRQIIATPHFIHRTAWAASKAKVTSAVNELRTYLQKEGIRLDIYPGMEIAIYPNVCQDIRKDLLLPLANSNMFLLEPSFTDTYYDTLKAVEECRSEEIEIIIAHPERIPALQRHPRRFLELLEMGVFFQVNISSLLGYMGTKSKESARFLLDHGAIYFLGSDAHDSNMRKPPSLEDLYRLEDEYGIDLRRFLTANALNIFHCEDIKDSEPQEARRTKRKIKVLSC